MRLTPILQGFALLILLGLPLLAVDEEKLGEELEEVTDRRSIYLSGGISLVVLAAVTLGVMVWQDVRPEQVGWRAGGLVPALAWATGVTVAGLLMVWATSSVFERFGFRESRLVLYLMPRTASQKRGFVLLVLVAAVCEELVYRGFALHVLMEWGGSAWMAVAVTAVSFGLAHGYQRLAGIVRATILGILLAVPVVETGSLFPAIAAHFWINAVIGLGGWRWLATKDHLADGEGSNGDG